MAATSGLDQEWADDDDEDVIQDSLQEDTVAVYYEQVNQRKRRASVELEIGFVNDLDMFRKHDGALVIQSGWRCRKARRVLAEKKARALVARLSAFLGEVLLRCHLMRPHREAFHEHRLRGVAARTVQRHARGRRGRLRYQQQLKEKNAREHEASRQQLHLEAHLAVTDLNIHYEQADIAQIEAKGPYAGGLAGPWDPQGERGPRRPEPEPELDLDPHALNSSDEEAEMQTPTPPVSKRKKGGRPAGLKTGRARRRGGSVEATMAFAGMTEAQKTSLVVRPNKTFRAAGNKIKAALHLANMIGPSAAAAAAGVTGVKGGAGEALPLFPKPAPFVPPVPRPQPPKKQRKGKKAGKNLSNTKPRYLQHLEPKKLPEKPNKQRLPPTVATQAGRRPESQQKLPPIGRQTVDERARELLNGRKTARETGSVRASRLTA